jgi:Pyridine nucleotide-disulphide oxidoreductase
MIGDQAVIIIGAGPYGLSIAAHLAKAGIKTRVFGKCMETWATGMPVGMFLKSAAAATDISDPDGLFTLKTFCALRGIPYDPLDMLLPVDLFTAYGLAFQQKFVPHLETQMVTRLAEVQEGYEVTLDDGTVIRAAQVIVATGIRRFGKVPAALAGLPDALLSHSSEASDLSHLRGKDVIVLGGGSSAADVAAALHRFGAKPTLVARRGILRFPPGGKRRGWYDAIRSPMTPLGPGWHKVLAWKGALLFHKMPVKFRMEVVRRYLGPSPTLSVKQTIESHVLLMLNAQVTSADVVDGRVRLWIRQDGVDSVVHADHVIAATGYNIALDRLGFLDDGLLRSIACTNGYPKLSTSFESSREGLYFVGTPSAVSFGPVMRFVCGTQFCAQRLTKHLRRVVRRQRTSAASLPEPQANWANSTKVSADPAA